MRRIFGGWALVAGVVIGAAGLWAFIYAHYHDPTPEADPMAMHLPTAYDLLHEDIFAFYVFPSGYVRHRAGWRQPCRLWVHR